MAGRILRGAVVGASTLLGKELAEELNDSSTTTWDLTLLDTGDAVGEITAAGDEALVIQTVSVEAFAGLDVVLFAGEGATANEYWKAAHKAGASIVDLTGALEGLPGVLVRSAWIEADTAPDLATVAVVAAHPVAALLALMETRLRPYEVKSIAATVLLPVSELGRAGVEELQQQTIGLLTFKPLKKDEYDAQVAFNLLASLGSASKVDLERVRSTISRQTVIMTGATPPAVQVIQAPVFHGFTASVFLEMSSEMDEKVIREALSGGAFHVAGSDDFPPSNESVAGASEFVLSLRPAGATPGSTFWLWVAGDNLRLAAKNAAGCAQELATLRPVSGVN